MTACPICGAEGTAPCTTGRDHKARLDAERAERRQARTPRPWDAAAVGRTIEAEGRRVGTKGTEHDLSELAGLRATLEAAITEAVVGLNGRGATWAGIGEAFGVSRSAAFQRYGKAVDAAGQAPVS